MKQGTKIVRIKINKDKDEHYYGKLAISNEPRMNETTEIFKLWRQKNLQGFQKKVETKYVELDA